MGISRRQQAEELFQRIVDLPAAERPGLLDRLCGDDPDLRGEVEVLLACFEDRRVQSLADVERDDEPDLIGQHVGPYKILQLIGEGGFGDVFLAEQREPLARRVALKVIKPGMDTRQVIARFEAERKMLALMDHPNIARVLDAGTTESGRPYFVMELVRGVSITRYCDEYSLSVRERLQLFTRICAAVQHAHQKGIIHRDLKPSNILVTLEDGRPTPKVIDFGVSKAVNQRLSEKTLFTEFGQFIGTPEYMSPEQAGASGVDIDTRTDIYSLGVLLYELVTGKTPFDQTTLRKAAVGEIQRIIRMEEPPIPSARVGRLEQEVESVATRRSTVPSSLRRLVRGELDWIVMKAIEKDRARRYETASALSHDIDNHLNHDPVQAGPPGLTYRLSKFTRRHRFGVLTTLLVVVALLIGLVVSTLALIQTERARKRESEQRAVAESSLKRESEQRAAAESSLKRAEVVTAFLRDTLASADPRLVQNRQTHVRFLLDGAARKLRDGALGGHPQAEADVRCTLAETYQSFGFYGEAEGQYRDAMSILTRLHGPESQPIIQAAAGVAVCLVRQHRFREAKKILENYLPMARRVLGDGHRDSLAILGVQVVVAIQERRFAAAERWCRRLLVFGRKHPDVAPAEMLTMLNNLGALLIHQRKYAQAEECIRAAVADYRRRLGESHPATLSVMHNLAYILYLRRSYPRAESLLRQTLEAEQRVLGDDHPQTARTVVFLVRLLFDQGKTDECRRVSAQNLARHKAAAEQPAPELDTLKRYIALLLSCVPVDLRDPAAAQAVAQRAAELSGWKNCSVLEMLAVAHYRLGDLDRTLEVLRKTFALQGAPVVDPLTSSEEEAIRWLRENQGTDTGFQALCDMLNRRRLVKVTEPLARYPSADLPGLWMGGPGDHGSGRPPSPASSLPTATEK